MEGRKTTIRPPTNDILVYICVLDFEATCWDDDGKSRWRMEIIEFPSVLIEWNTKTGKTRRLGEFQEYCKPLASEVSPFCEELTGITQETVNQGGKFPEVIRRHYKWLKTLIPVEQRDVYIMTVGQWDLAIQLPRDLKRWNMTLKNIPKVYKRFYNIKADFVKFIKPKNKRGFGMAKMLKFLNLKLDGRHHSGIDDCKNTAKIFEKLVRKGIRFENLKLNLVS